MTDSRYDVVIVGGGIVGLAVALEITRRFRRLRLLLLEKEDRVGRHQSGHNSGVIHSGVYYKPGSHEGHAVRRRRARHGRILPRTQPFPIEVCGKVIVATHEEEFPRLEELRRRGEANGLTGLSTRRRRRTPRNRAARQRTAGPGRPGNRNHRLRRSLRKICRADSRSKAERF